MRNIILGFFFCGTFISCKTSQKADSQQNSYNMETDVPQNISNIERSVSPRAESARNAGSQGPYGSNAHFYEK